MNIQFITIYGEKRPFLIDLGRKEFTENFKPGDPVPLNAMEIVAYWGFRLGHLKLKKKIDFALEDMEDWLDDNHEALWMIGKLMEDSLREAKREYRRLNHRLNNLN